MSYWATPAIPRDQLVLFPHRLDEAVDADHPVRFFDEVFGEIDWCDWECHYCGVAGQPAIHPSVLVKAIIYGMSVGIRTSRTLEGACRNRMDFMWLVEGREIDHTTFAKFRKEHVSDLKKLFRQVGEMGIAIGLSHLNRVTLDGTRVKANSSRHSTATAKTLEEKLAALDKQLDELFAEAERAEAQEHDLYGEEVTPNRLPRKLSDLATRRQALQKALESARAKQSALSASEKQEGRQVSVPVADPDSVLMPNKEGGFAPNYTPMAAVDTKSGMIVDADVLNQSTESAALIPTVERIQETFGVTPKEVVADCAHGSGGNLEALEAAQITGYIPIGFRGEETSEVAKRENPSQPVVEEKRANLPLCSQTGKLDRSAFLYDATSDCYWCPMGRKMTYIGTRKFKRDWGTSLYRRYQSPDCTGCPLSEKCLVKDTIVRRVERDQHEPLREKMRERLKTPEGKAIYKERRVVAERPFAVIKARMGVRQFLMRGLANVKTEWLWVCTTANVLKLALDRRRGRAAAPCPG